MNTQNHTGKETKAIQQNSKVLKEVLRFLPSSKMIDFPTFCHLLYVKNKEIQRGKTLTLNLDLHPRNTQRIQYLHMLHNLLQLESRKQAQERIK